MNLHRKQNRVLLALFFLATGFANITNAQVTFPENGAADKKHILYAFTNAVVFTDYKTRIDSAVLLVRDGQVEAVGKNLKVPSDALVTDVKGKFIYPSFIDIYSDYGMPDAKKPKPGEDRGPQFLSATKGAYNWNQAIHPEYNAVQNFGANEKKAEELRKLGFGAVVTHNKDGIARGTGAAVLLGDDKENDLVIKDWATANYSFDKGSSTQDYPSSLMGSIALIRQTYYDAKWYAAGGSKKEFNISLDAFNRIQSLPQVFETGDKYTDLRASRIADEFGVKYILKGGGDEYQRVDEIKKCKASLIVPVNFPQPFEVEDPYDAMQVTLGEMKHWELAPYNAATLDKAGIEFAFTTTDLKEKKEFAKNMRKAVECGLSEEAALKALTATPAMLTKIDDKTGALKKGMIANFIITSGKLFQKETKIYENWVRGERYIIQDINQQDLRGNYRLMIGKMDSIPMKAGGDDDDMKVSVMDDTLKSKVSFSNIRNTVTMSFELKNRSPKGVYRLSGNTSDGKNWKGKAQLPDGSWDTWNAVFVSEFVKEEKKDSTEKDSVVIGETWFPNKSYGWKSLPVAETVLVKNATVWTNEQEGIMKNADVLFADGKIVKVGSALDNSEDYKKLDEKSKVKVIDGTGKHLTAGIIDEHSHIAISRGVNEGTQSVTSEVRIGDVINPDDINIYRNLSGGVTSSHLLHGSANAIGGQTILIKLRWGASPEQMKFENADGFIKFALGENVKQSNWGDRQTVRFPQTRMGVEQVYYDAFTRAKEYEKEWNAFSKAPRNSTLSAPRKDLELDALVEIMNRKRFITCHSYVQSEINMLMHVGDSMGFKVNTFTHILEGYKVADKMKAHGAGASSFADWWAYKYEVVEAIPHNGSILHDVGVVTGFNSDDAEMARRLNQEAAKAVKYGGVSEEEALKFVTLNPAKLLHIDQRVGSVKAGKDADLVIWSDNPLSIYARAEKTFVDGKLYYDKDRDAQLRNDLTAERARLIKKMIAAKKKGEKTQGAGKNDEIEYHCDTLLPNY